MRIIILMLISILQLSLTANPIIYQDKSMKITLQSFEHNVNSHYIAYMNNTLEKPTFYHFEVIREAPTMFINVQIAQQETNRALLNLVDLDGCDIMRNPMFNKVLSTFKKQLLGNQSFTCPIKPGIYYLESTLSNKTTQPKYPNGKFQLNVRFNIKPKGDFLMDLIWKYRVVKL